MAKRSGKTKKTNRVVVLDGGYDSYETERDILGAAGYDLELFSGARDDVEGRIAFAQGAAGVFIRWTGADAAFLDAIPGVRAIVRYGVGYDNIDLDAAKARGVAVSNVQGYANHAVSDHALALILACLRGLQQAPAHRQDAFGEAPETHMPELHTLTLGIVGLGRIGGTLSAKAMMLFGHVLASDPYIPHERFARLGAEPVDLPQLLNEADVVSLHCNLTDETRHLIGAPAFERMRPKAILINTARGPVVDEAALYEALESGRLHAAGLDVYAEEPPTAQEQRLLAHARVVGTGHYAWYSNQASRELQRRAADNMVALLAGEGPPDRLA